MKIISTLKCTEYSSPGHPESPQRIIDSYHYLKEKGYGFIEPKLCNEADILLVHSKELLEKVKSGNFFDLDTPNLKNIYYYAQLSAGAAILAAQIAREEKSFALMRPPGHHATKDNLGGFCYFNNIAIAIKKILPQFPKIAILDIDVHHGNGTEDIFLGKKEIIYISLHQSPYYPGTGTTSRDNCYNFPLPIQTNEDYYLEVFKKALDILKNFNPKMIAISAGFDTFSGDPLAGFELELESYYKIGKMIADLNKPTFGVLEGGYSPNLAQCIEQFLKGLEASK